MRLIQNALQVVTVSMLCITANALDMGSCKEISGVEHVLKAPGVFVGDMHGTEQSPRFLSDLACHVIAAGRPLVIAMEYDAEDQVILDAFLMSKKQDEQAVATLLTNTRYWKRVTQDGRTSAAMRDALLRIRQYARAGGEVKLIAYDLRKLSLRGPERDRASAGILERERPRRPVDAYWIVFGGHVHARKSKGLTWQGAPAGYENYESLGYLIRHWGLIHLNMAYQGGTAWNCYGSPLTSPL